MRVGAVFTAQDVFFAGRRLAIHRQLAPPDLLAEWLMRGRDGVIEQPGYRSLFYQLLLCVEVLAVLELGFPLGGGGAGGGFEDAVEGGFAGETRCQAHFSDLEVGVVAQQFLCVCYAIGVDELRE